MRWPGLFSVRARIFCVVRRCVVRVFYDEGSGIVVVSDHIKVGERIIICGNEVLRDGQRVDVVEY